MLHLTGLTRLRWLRLSNTHFDDDGLRYLSKKMSGLESLWLDRTNVTDEGLDNVKALSNLENIQLNGTRVTGAGLVYLTGLARLKYVWLDNEQIDDEGLKNLQKLSSLEQLLIPGPQPSTARRIELKRALPRPEIKEPHS